ncbi:hypothetical protein BRD06_04435 [Halobacteriales archaeon QS_9_67_15]|nr:MAG: hypothetical protein BRD06_04435 [Halobacteriales archaeon QS_9_67_15]
MKKLIVHGDPGFRKDAVISVDGEELVVFGVARQGEWHGPDRPQLWCRRRRDGERLTGSILLRSHQIHVRPVVVVRDDFARARRSGR